MKNALEKISSLADYFETKIAQTVPSAQDLTGEQARSKLIQLNLERSLGPIKLKVREFLGLKNEADMQMSGMYTPKDKSISMAINFPSHLKNYVYQRLQANRNAHAQNTAKPAPTTPPTATPANIDVINDLSNFIKREVSNANTGIQTRVDSISFV